MLLGHCSVGVLLATPDTSPQLHPVMAFGARNGTQVRHMPELSLAPNQAFF